MSDRHRDLYVSKLLSGFLCLIGCIFLLYLSLLEAETEAGEWYWWALGASVLLCTGIYLCIAAAAHKVKSDFSRRRKSRDTVERKEDI